MGWTLILAVALMAGCSLKSPRPLPPDACPQKAPTSRRALDPKLRPYVVNGTRYYPLPDAEGFVEYGKASWYGAAFQGRPTASGEIYDMYRLTAAHKTLPLGTVVEVVNLANQRKTIVRINDRGPFVKGRHIDLSLAAAREVGLVGPGVSEVRIAALGRAVAGSDKGEVLVETPDFEHGLFSVQVGAFKEPANARQLADRLRPQFGEVEIRTCRNSAGEAFYRVWVARVGTLAAAARVQRQLEALGFADAFTIGL